MQAPKEGRSEAGFGDFLVLCSASFGFSVQKDPITLHATRSRVGVISLMGFDLMTNLVILFHSFLELYVYGTRRF